MSVKPAPFDLTPSVISALIGERPAHSTRVVQVPLLPIRLVDQPRRSDDPRLSRANDNGGRA